ncbi:uncharacterized protein LOC141614120 [Silene latifolia]|uniref:uncharacterized protein LOC141614120 n=1 Tax=Silene latifolia TaxID=37657 RepID=UPI003D76EB11
MVHTPARKVMKLSRQYLIDAGKSSTHFGNYSFLEDLNDTARRVGVGTNGNALPPWVGDFNTVLAPFERLGGQSTRDEMQDFQYFIDTCGVMDMPGSGSYYTWNNKQDPDSRVYSRLDRAFDMSMSQIGKKSFKYYNMWSSSEYFLPCVQQVWNHVYNGTKMFCVVKKLKALKQPFKTLSRNQYGDIENNSIRAWKDLEYIQELLRQDPLNADWIMKETEAIQTYKELHYASNSFLFQKSKATWIS